MKNNSDPINPAKGERLLYEEVAARLSRLIEQGTYRPGERIPSVRQMSRQQQVSVSTVLLPFPLTDHASPSGAFGGSATDTGRIMSISSWLRMWQW